MNPKSFPNKAGASIAPLLVMLALGVAQPLQASEFAAAASPTIIVGNTPACLNATFTSIQAAITAAPATNATISVCAGTYVGKVLVTDKTNLKLIGKPGARIVPEGDSFSGDLVEVANSKNVTFQGFTIDGRGTLNPDVPATGILYSDSSGTIARNTVVNWTTPRSATEDAGIVAIQVTADDSPAVSIESNVITGFQDTAVGVEAGGLITIRGNAISTTVDDVQDITGIDVKPSTTTAAHGKISGNKLSVSGTSEEVSSLAISISETSPFEVSSNTILNFTLGIQTSSECANIDNTQITGNRVINSEVAGIVVLAEAEGMCSLVHADNYKIIGNAVLNRGAQGETGIVLVASGSDMNRAFIRNALVKNNTITNFFEGVAPLTATGGVIDGVFVPNRVK